MDLAAYDLILVNSSAGKDSQAMLDYLVELADTQGVDRRRLVVAHADLGRVEWGGTVELARKQAWTYGLRFEVEKRPQGDLLDHVRDRGMWPSSSARYCTSDHKRGQVSKVVTRLVRELELDRPARVLNCLGIRAQESSARAKKVPFSRDRRLTGKGTVKVVDQWFPIFEWTEAAVWARIDASGVPHHPAYDLGMPRLSCCFCIFAPREALQLAGRHNIELLREYVDVEREIDHDFRIDLKLADVLADVEAGAEPAAKVASWSM